MMIPVRCGHAHSDVRISRIVRTTPHTRTRTYVHALLDLATKLFLNDIGAEVDVNPDEVEVVKKKKLKRPDCYERKKRKLTEQHCVKLFRCCKCSDRECQ